MQGDHLRFNGVWLSFYPARWFKAPPAGRLRLICISVLVCAGFISSRNACSQDAAKLGDPGAPGQINGLIERNPWPAPASLAEVNAAPAVPVFPGADEAVAGGQVREVTQERPKSRPEQELIVEGLVSYGNYRIFASGYDEKLFTAGLEYDRHSWGYFLKAQVDYVAEFLPFVLLDKPLSTDIFGNPVPLKQKNIREYVPGVGISPIGFRMQWRSKKAIRPYLEAKGGILGFTKKVPSTEASYENFSLQSGTGMQVKLSDRWGLRLGLFGDFHFSNGFVVPVDPGLDVMNANLGVSYHF
jgi:Lipid A 3-O-deacylase (PagL)